MLPGHSGAPARGPCRHALIFPEENWGVVQAQRGFRGVGKGCE